VAGRVRPRKLQKTNEERIYAVIIYGELEYESVTLKQALEAVRQHLQEDRGDEDCIIYKQVPYEVTSVYSVKVKESPSGKERKA
jgi:hypothetical protein